MAAELRASFILQLEDRLSGGIAALSRRLEALAALGRRVSLAGLDTAQAALDKVGAAAERAGGKVEGIGRSARSALSELRRLSSEPILVNAGGTAFLPPSLGRAAMAATIAAAATAGGGGRPPALPSLDAPFHAGEAPLLLGGPAGGRGPIPLNLGGGGLAGLRSQLSSTLGQARALNGELRELGHGGLAALTTGFGLFEPVREYAAYENALRHIAITAEVPKADLPAAITQLAQQYNRLAVTTGQNAEKVAEAANFLITTGIGRSAVDAMLPIVAQAATAYNTPIGDSVQAIFSLRENLHVRDQDLPGTVSAMALAGKLGHFSFADMSRFLPDVAPLASMAGINGPEGARWLMAAEETSRRNAGTSGEANTNLRDFIGHLFGGDKRGLAHQFRTMGVDLNDVMRKGVARGVNPAQAVLDQVEQMTHGKSELEVSRIVGNLFHNQQSAAFVRAYLADQQYFHETLEKLLHADNGTILGDFGKAFDAPQVKLNQLEERLRQLVRRFGEGFAGLVPPISAGLGVVLELFDAVDGRFPGLANGVLGWVGGFLALSAALGVASPLLRVVWTGAKLLIGTLGIMTNVVAFLGRSLAALLIAGGPIVWILAAIAGAALLIWANWDKLGPWFHQVWQSVVGWFQWFLNWVSGWIGGSMRELIDEFKQAWEGLKEFFSGLWGRVTSEFDVLVKRVRDQITDLRKFLGLEGNGYQVPANPPANEPAPDDPNRIFQHGAYHPGGGAGGSHPMQVAFAPIEIRVTTDGGTRVDAPKTLTPRTMDRGEMFARA